MQPVAGGSKAASGPRWGVERRGHSPLVPLSVSACQLCAVCFNVYLEAIFKNLFGRIFKQPTRRWICNLNTGLSGPRPSPHPPGQGRRPSASCFPFGALAWLQDSPCTAVWLLLVTSPVPASILQMTSAGPGRAQTSQVSLTHSRAPLGRLSTPNP